VVLGSSFLGVYAHAGFLNGMAEAGFAPARIAGASAGALAGAMYACGLRGEALRAAALDVKLRRSFVDAGWLWRFPGLLTSLWSSGLFSGAGAVARLRELCGDIDLADLAVPPDIAVTDADTSTLEIRREGPLAELVMASCAVPVLFEVRKVGAKCYLDGGIAGDLPFGHLLDDPSVDVLVLHRIRHRAGSTPGFFRRAVGHAFGVTRRTIAGEVHRLRVDLARARGKRVVEMETLTDFPGLFSHRLAPECYELGRATGRAVFQRLESADG
jgi:NTE family protein